MLYFNQYAIAPQGTPLFDNAATGTGIMKTIPSSSDSEAAWKAWAESLFAQFRSDVQSGKLPQVSWIVAPAGYTEHSDWPINYGAWYISQVFDILVSNPADPPRFYTVEPDKTIRGSWNVSSSYDLSVYGPNGFIRYFKGSVGASAAALYILSSYGTGVDDQRDHTSIKWSITNIAAQTAEVHVLDAYTGSRSAQLVKPNETTEGELSLTRFLGWYDLIVTVAGDTTFNYRLAGHVESGTNSWSDPALGGLVTLKG